MGVPLFPGTASADPCAPVVNAIACENSKAGTPSSIWEINGAGPADIQGYATEMSVNAGETVNFKVATTASSYRLDIYRMGYYAGNGARKVATLNRSGAQSQPNCIVEPSTGLVDCGNWGVSASWAVPASAVSGIYFAHLIRTDGGNSESHIYFVVRNDASQSNLLFQTSDTTWQAYNTYGGNSLYVGSPVGRAYKVSYNRPITTRTTGAEDMVWNAEYPMVRFLESNGYDVSYTSGIDTDRRGSLLRNHKAFLSVGHDEYWSAAQRANVEAARDAGVHLAFFSGNEVFWKTRWERSVDGSNTPYRTLVTYKETHANAKIDPAGQNVWTGTWRDPRFSPPADGGRPENALTGTIFKVQNTRDLQVPEADGKMRFWRGTSVASQPAGGVMTLGSGLVGYEWDEDPDNGFRPAGLIRMSSTTVTAGAGEMLLDHGTNFGPGTATHRLTMHRAASGALVFGAGTVQWSWGLDSNHDRGTGTASLPVQQATVNLFADMGAQPATLQSGLTAATASTDTTAPTTTITSPAAGASVEVNAPVTITGTATDTGGAVGAVEVSTDGGATWHPATGRGNWTYTWTPTALGAATVRARASDDSVNLGAVTSNAVTVAQRVCPCSLWNSATVPSITDHPDPNSVEVGVKFRSDVAGQVTGVRFYKSPSSTGTHVGHLWSASGQLLATVNFANETASGWQQALFSNPVTISANTTYVVSYYVPNGRYAFDQGYFASSGRDAVPLHALRNGVDGLNGVYRYGAGGGFPTSSWEASNYWVDVVFSTGSDTTPPTVTGRSPASGATGVPVTTTVAATFSEAVQSGSASIVVRNPAGTAVTGTTSYNAGTNTATFSPAAALAANTAYTATVSGARDAANNTMSTVSWTFTTAPAQTGTYSLWSNSAVPAVPDEPDPNAVEVGVKFRSDVAGQVTGMRFYKSPNSTGTHVGHLWSASGQLLATLTFTNETASGWQQALFSNPVTISANTTYVVSYYAPNGRYAQDTAYFASSGRDAAPLHALRSGVDGLNGVYRYGAGGGFPTSSWEASNYWVDVVFAAS
ncbi:hypothetical protein Vau01_116500 [Virgisporangium aurantiacum]|uniref:DUF4082 domain-containing protein n=2 Tax=Virgisporangium aurantiacum TaxID=175570 RepID=A0A8J4E7C1_9ACTN|nr:hypothetical protein Vau01_116500 [Virgisporangium aurantiacum]